MQLQLQSFAALVGASAAAVQGAARQLVDLTAGSTLRAMLEASASVALWVQWLIVQVLQTTRASTSEAGDLDSWMADFSVTRLPAVAARGVVRFSRFTAIGDALVPVGAMVRTADGTQLFSVIDDLASGFDGILGGYPLSAGVVSVDVPVQANVVGAAGNVQSGAVTLIATSLAGIDTAGNVGAFSGGLDQESDAALRGRFEGFLASRARATPIAIGYAIAGVQQGLRHTLQENVLPDGSPRMGSFVVTVDDGSGAPSATLLTAVATAVEAMRPVSVSYAVRAPVVVHADVSMTVAIAAGVAAGPVRGAVEAALRGHVDSLPLGAALVWSRLLQVAYGVSPFVENVGSVLVAGGSADLVVPVSSVVKAGTVSVS